MDNSVYYAHSANPAGDWHHLADHLCGVGRLARAFAGDLVKSNQYC